MVGVKIVAMVDRSAGNESVGVMWTETKIFDITEPIENIYAWLTERLGMNNNVGKITANVKLSIAQE